jgi:hypothetical protein
METATQAGEPCSHPDDDAWYERYAYHEEGMVIVYRDCLRCGHRQSVHADKLSDEERAWNDRSDAIRKALGPGCTGAQVLDVLLGRKVGQLT